MDNNKKKRNNKRKRVVFKLGSCFNSCANEFTHQYNKNNKNKTPFEGVTAPDREPQASLCLPLLTLPPPPASAPSPPQGVNPLYTPLEANL